MKRVTKLFDTYHIIKGGRFEMAGYSEVTPILEYVRRSRASKALPLDDLSGAVSAYYQRQIEPVVLDTIKKCGDHVSKDLA